MGILIASSFESQRYRVNWEFFVLLVNNVRGLCFVLVYFQNFKILSFFLLMCRIIYSNILDSWSKFKSEKISYDGDIQKFEFVVMSIYVKKTRALLLLQIMYCKKLRCLKQNYRVKQDKLISCVHIWCYRQYRARSLFRGFNYFYWYSSTYRDPEGFTI